MHPGQDAITALRRLHPEARWGWHNEMQEFSLLELYPKHEVPTKIYEPWRRKGPVFGEPWDHDRYEPLWLANFPPSDLRSQRFVPVIRRWLTPLHRRMYDSALERGKKFQDKISNLAGQIGEEIWWDHQRNPHRGQVVARKHAPLQDQEPRDLTHEFMPPFPAEDLLRLESA
jgi:hypothetical protein